jgi:hypothetical protein
MKGGKASVLSLTQQAQALSQLPNPSILSGKDRENEINKMEGVTN